ncbi:MAG: hypothetical protein KTR18_01945 [Acidiferrobacterales bacterium]|nr:hypothetical protein [Acidiferrobacterales bacterium]
MSASKKYLDTLLQYYEEEISGEAYLYDLINHFAEKEKLTLLAKVERHAAIAVAPLLTKYKLVPRAEDKLTEEGLEHVAPHAAMEWRVFGQYMADRYPRYLDDFAELENMAPHEDRTLLQFLTSHEVAAIEFARRELENDPESCAPLSQYLATPHPLQT